MHAFIIWLNATSEVVLASAWPMFLQSSLLIVCLFVLDLLVKKKVKAVVRYLFWMLILVKLILPPTLSSPISIGHWSGRLLSPEIVMGSPPPFQLGEASRPRYSDAEIMTLPQAPMPENQALTPTMTNPEESSPVSFLTWQALILAMWILGVSAMAIFLIQRTFFVRALLAHSVDVPQALIDLLSQCRTTLQMSRPVRLRQTSLSTSPSVCGLARPTILLPSHIIESFDFQDLKSILLHELAHVKRGDLWVNLCQTLLQVFYFFNPLLWIANAHIRKIREQAVDETVLAAMGHEAEAYPKTLITISRHVWGRPVLSLRLLGVAESPRALSRRIIHITSQPFPKTVRIGLANLAGILLIGALLLPMAQAFDQMPAEKGRPPSKKAPMDPNVLAQFPEEIGDWIGQDAPLDEGIILATDTDAHMNRRYVHQNGLDGVSFVARGVQARDLIYHRPEVRYMENGWDLTDKKKGLELSLKDGTKLPCTVMQFSKGGLATSKIMVLDYYLVDGEYCLDLSSLQLSGGEYRHRLSSLRSKLWRGSGTVDHVVQVQIVTSVKEALGADSSATKRVSDFAVASAVPLAALFEKSLSEKHVLSQFPQQIDDWIGQDVPLAPYDLDEGVLLWMPPDDLLNRRYVRGNGAETVSFYVASGVKARDLIPHRPEVCYAGNGWALTDNRFLELPLKDGTKLPCNVMQFFKGGGVKKRHMVLHYYLVDGEYCHDVSLLRSKALRGSGTVDHVAQVRIVTPVTEALGSDSSGTNRVSDFAVASAAPLAALYAKPEPPIDSEEREQQ